MFTEMTRTYSKKRRAESEEETRTRIAQAAMELHQELGPAQTTISAIAERAGVQRLTVYRHYPTDADIFQACTSHWGTQNPPPDVAIWAEIAEPLPRARKALATLYGFYRSTQAMLRAIHRDRAAVALVDQHMKHFDAYLALVSDDLIAAFPRGGGVRRQRTIRHAVKFTTWDSFAADGVSDADMTDLIVAWLG